MTRSALVCGAGGFIGGDLVMRLRKNGFRVGGVTITARELCETDADDLRDHAPCAMAAQALAGEEIDSSGDGLQTRSFFDGDERIAAPVRLMRSSFEGPVNMGYDGAVPTNHPVDTVSDIAKKLAGTNPIFKPIGVHRCNSRNAFIRQMLGWAPLLNWNRTYDDLRSDCAAGPIQPLKECHRYGASLCL